MTDKEGQSSVMVGLVARRGWYFRAELKSFGGKKRKALFTRGKKTERHKGVQGIFDKNAIEVVKGRGSDMLIKDAQWICSFSQLFKKAYGVLVARNCPNCYTRTI